MKKPPVASRRPDPHGLQPWVWRHRADAADTARLTTAMAIDDAGRREETSAEHRVDIERTHYTSTGARYSVTYLGKTLIESTRDPELEACRALLARGIRGTLLTYSPGSSEHSMRIDIEKGAKLMTIDNVNDGPRFGRYRPHPKSGGGDDAE
jgi:hypothetical protein